MLDYFGENFDPTNCQGTCDNCAYKGHTERRDLTLHAKAVVNLFKVSVSLKSRFGRKRT